MKIFSYLRSFLVGNSPRETKQDIPALHCKEIPKESPLPQLTESCEITEPLLTVSQAAKKNGVTRQAIFFAIKMKRLNAKKINDTWLIAANDLQDYSENRYCRSKSRNQGELIFDKSKGFFSIAEAAKFLNKNTNHIYYLVRMGTLKSHRQGSAIVIQDVELYKYADFISKKSQKNMVVG